MFITHRKDLKKDGANPTMLYGYGGFDISELPRFRSGRCPPSSSAAASGRRRTCAAAASMARRGTRPGCSRRSRTSSTTSSPRPSIWSRSSYASPQTLGIMGGSNGGLLVGAVHAAAAGSVRRGAAGGRRHGHAALPPVHRRRGVGRPDTARRRTRRTSPICSKYSPLHNVEAGHVLSGDARHDGRSRRPRRAEPLVQVRRRRCRRRRGATSRC